MDKVGIIHFLRARCGYRDYLEVCTSTTGNHYRRIDKAGFSSSRRLMYNCPADFHDDMPIDFRLIGQDAETAFARVGQGSFDICLIDGWHEYDRALRDITQAYALLRDGGVLVVHDCLPPRPEVAVSFPIPGEWCGVSYKAYLDFVVHNELQYCTIDTDYGCGLIFKGRKSYFGLRSLKREDNRQVRDTWRAGFADHDEAYDFMQANQRELLMLRSVRQLQWLRVRKRNLFV